MVHFVGAGPGASDLITVRGAALLGNADVVIYTGSLVNPEILRLCRIEGTAIYNSADMTLPEIIEVIREHAVGFGIATFMGLFFMLITTMISSCGAMLGSGGSEFMAGAYQSLPADIETWHHWAFVYNGTDVRAYLDGKQVMERTADCAAGDPEVPFDIGGQSGEDSFNFNGAYDEIRLSPLARDAAWARAEFLSGCPGFVAASQAMPARSGLTVIIR